MAVVMSMEWPGVTPEEYDRVVELLDLETSPADGGLFHVAGFEGGALRVVDIWESPEHFEQFRDTRLLRAVQEAGLERGQPNVRVYEVHNHFRSPGVELPELGTAKIAQ